VVNLRQPRDDRRATTVPKGFARRAYRASILAAPQVEDVVSYRDAQMTGDDRNFASAATARGRQQLAPAPAPPHVADGDVTTFPHSRPSSPDASRAGNAASNFRGWTMARRCR
jgi:hypothetical protein